MRASLSPNRESGIPLSPRDFAPIGAGYYNSFILKGGAISMRITKTDLAWAAGVIDGRGLRIRFRKPDHYEAQIEVKINHLQTCERLFEMFGVGESKKVQPKRPENRSEVYHWICKRKSDVSFVLEQVRPFMFKKADIADIVLDFCKTNTRSQEAEVYLQYMQGRADGDD